jgi:apolipoprotein N-acyltransferase
MVAIFVFRAVETGLPLLSCANGGVSCAIAPSGEVVAVLDKVMEPGVLAVRVPAARGATPYRRGGRWALQALLALLAIYFFAVRRGKSPRNGPEARDSAFRTSP